MLFDHYHLLFRVKPRKSALFTGLLRVLTAFLLLVYEVLFLDPASSSLGAVSKIRADHEGLCGAQLRALEHFFALGVLLPGCLAVGESLLGEAELGSGGDAICGAGSLHIRLLGGRALEFFGLG